MSEKEKLVDILNDVIVNAVWHGGDPGGAYNQNEDGLRQSIQSAIEHFGLEGYAISMCDGTPIITPEGTLDNAYGYDIDHLGGGVQRARIYRREVVRE